MADLIPGHEYLDVDTNEEIVTAEDADVDIEDLEDDDDDDYDDDDDVDVTSADAVPDVIDQLIDIREPLVNLKRILEKRFKVDLAEYDFWLQDSQLLPEETSLVDQCVQGEGTVQINVEIKTAEDGLKKINIIDVLKPADDSPDQAEFGSPPRGAPLPPLNLPLSPDSSPEKSRPPRRQHQQQQQQPDHPPDTVTRWVVCATFRKEQERLNIPTDPVQWNRAHVSHWIKWVIKEFPRTSIDTRDWEIDGRELCAISHDEFKKKVPVDPSDLVWTHLELLKKCQFVAVVQGNNEPGSTAATAAPSKSSKAAGASAASLGAISPTKASPTVVAQQPVLPNAASTTASGGGGGGALSVDARKTHKKPPVRLGAHKFTVMSESALGNRTGNNGQVQLWQFLLELLTEKDHREVIHWIGDDGEFKLENPEIVAQLWGTRKNKPSMNYEKLSRALRYYYDGDMISKVHGKRFVYKFVCDLKQLLGYSAAELNQLVTEAEQKTLGRMK